jgi:phenylpropionate dioxygenase-like ring-hydroxylating dioxygenase large terminal subunit
MVSSDANRVLTESGPGTPGGHVLRQYWQPAALTEELHGERPVVPVTLMNEELVLFTDEQGNLGLLGRYCPHRGVDLCFGRLEDGGLRCPLHGWLFDVEGACLETPAEPESSTFHERIRHRSYPVLERNGIVWAYLGEGDSPPLPDFDCLIAPRSQVFAFKGMWNCNWLQSHEVGIDPSHAAFLHRFLDDDSEEYGQQFRDLVADTGVTTVKLMREASAPTIVADPTPFGFRMRTTRNYRGEFTHVRISNCIFPNAITIAMSREMSITQWHVPIDDTSSYWYSMFVSFGEPVDADLMREQRISQVAMPDYRPLTSAADSWGYSAAEQQTSTYTGMGRDINVHDQWAVESQGPIYDRLDEHLSPADVGIRTHRRMFLAAAEEPSPSKLVGRNDPVHGPAAIEAVTTGEDFDEAWQDLDRARRAASGWAPALDYG